MVTQCIRQPLKHAKIFLTCMVSSLTFSVSHFCECWERLCEKVHGKIMVDHKVLNVLLDLFFILNLNLLWMKFWSYWWLRSFPNIPCVDQERSRQVTLLVELKTQLEGATVSCTRIGTIEITPSTSWSHLEIQLQTTLADFLSQLDRGLRTRRLARMETESSSDDGSIFTLGLSMQHIKYFEMGKAQVLHDGYASLSRHVLYIFTDQSLTDRRPSLASFIEITEQLMCTSSILLCFKHYSCIGFNSPSEHQVVNIYGWSWCLLITHT